MRGPLVAAAAAFAGVAAVGLPEARAGRPYDAPRIVAGEAIEKRPELPPLPAEYLTQESAWLKVAYHPSTQSRIRGLLREAEAVRAELVRELGAPVLAKVEVRLAAVPAEMARLAAQSLPSYAGSVALSDSGVVVMAATSPLSLEPPDLEVDLRHALAHLALDEVLGARSVPRWFHEAFALRFAGGGEFARARALAWASLAGEPFRLGLLEGAFPSELPDASPIAMQATDFVRFLSKEGNGEGLKRLAQHVRSGESFDRALALATGAEGPALEAKWQADARKRYVVGPALVLAAILALAVLALTQFRGAARRKVAARAVVRARVVPELPAKTQAAPELDPATRSAEITLQAERASARKPAAVLSRRAQGIPKVEHGGRWHTLH